ncbi:LysR family transcriptional regulator [Amaricoccus solimangrovi]|uniref:LysR family transcriptional regulator n=1 Tax=Amaricoccus solimangrovi TaxID=2589815 RepID=UPI0015E309FA|nr:LysR family transcriptional regulator [Amaricoccus solimangrovi]
MLDLGDQLQNLRMFLFAADAQSIAGAAKQLYKSPSAITRSIMELEKVVGVQLLERNSRGILPNAYGDVVLARSRRIEAELGQAAEDLATPRSQGTPPSPSAISHFLFNGRKLRLLIHLADSRKISTAAARLDISQSGASMALSRIEAAVGEPLFHRGMHGMIATEMADGLVMRAKRVFAELRHMLSEISMLSGSLAGSVVAGTLPLGRTYVLPMAIAATLERYPGIRVTTIENHFEQLVTDLRSGEIDAVLGVPRDESQRQGLSVEPLFLEGLRVIARAGHPIFERGAITLADLGAERWVLPWSNSLSHRLIEEAFRLEGLEPPVASVESADLQVMRQLLLSSDMLAIASPRQLSYELRSGLFLEVPVALRGTEREVALMTREGAMLSPAALAVLDAIREQATADPRRMELLVPD